MQLSRGGITGRAATAVTAGILLVAALAGCGDDKKADTDAAGQASETPSASPTPSGLSGSWAASPGQADKVQQALTAKGFECTRSADTAADLRLCSKGRKSSEPNRVEWADLSYLSDAQGTVVIARMQAAGWSVTDLNQVMAQAVLPAADAAVLSAGGTKLTWGAMEDVQNGKLLTVHGWTPEASYVPAFKPLPTTKEKALPALQAAKLTCKFQTTDEWGGDRPGLSCTDRAFKVKDEDGSMEGATAELVLIDHGSGIDGLVLDGRHSRTPAENARGVRLMVPRALGVDPDPGLRDAGAWILKHLDGVPHSAYVGQWRVDLSVVPDGGIAGWPYVRATLSQEDPDLGKKGSETPSWSDSPSVSETPDSPGPSETPAG